MQKQACDEPVTVAIGLGSNLGDRLGVLRAAVAELAPYVVVTALSPIYATPPAYVTDQPPFLNAALLGTTHLTPLALLWSLKEIERELGRQPSFHHGPRLIDLDLIFYGDMAVHAPEITLPHPRLAEREFVLRPLIHLAPDWRHPETGLTIAAMLEALPERTAVALADASLGVPAG